MSHWRVHKFGGSSVANADCMRRVAQILEQEGHSSRLAVVLSACRGVTDQLLELVNASTRQDAQVTTQLERIRHRHADIANELLSDTESREYLQLFDADCADISSILRAASLTQSASSTSRDVIAGFGEIWSTRLFARYYSNMSERRVKWVDARGVVAVEWHQLGPSVRWNESRANAASLRDAPETLIITGFIARDIHGLQTTLGRNGSDFSASIFGDLLDADEIHIWTDVDGVLSADPRRVPDARVIESLSYQEAMELAYFGAKVLHPQTMAPAVAKNIPIRIRNTFNPAEFGTVISSTISHQPFVKGVTSIERVGLINVEGAGMIGVPGTAQRLFGALREHDISVIMISQGGSEHSICFAVPDHDSTRTESILRNTFMPELNLGQIQNIDKVSDCSIVSVVGDGMSGHPGVAGKVFAALGTASVNVRAIAQGASERNISVVINSVDTTRALSAVHSNFYLSPHTVSLGLVGPGVVGRALLEQLALQSERLMSEAGLDLRLRAIAASERMLLGEPRIPFRWPGTADLIPTDLSRLEEHVQADHLPHAVLVDCSASAEVARLYPRWLEKGIHVVTPNKRASSGEWEFFTRIDEARRAGGSHYLYEATVGAGLPILSTLRDLRHTGDEIICIEGILSGTLAYLFNVWDGSRAFSAVVREARTLGYTEPDPRDDLSGSDVARKLVIMAREIGLRLELRDIEVESLIPESLVNCSVEEFLNRLPEFDNQMLERHSSAHARARLLRYVAVLDAESGRATVGLIDLERSHPFAMLNLTDNVVRFTTRRYRDNPLVVQGPGAGPDVTAGGVFADLLRVCAYLGAKI
jgi:aspartokinase/homoserine dehydrogenase 1